MNADVKRTLKIVILFAVTVTTLMAWGIATVEQSLKANEERSFQAAQQVDGVAVGASCKLLGMNVTVNHVFIYARDDTVDVITGSLRVINVKRTLLKQCAS